MILKERWELTDDDDLSEDAELRVLTANGRARAGVDIYKSWLTNTCGGGDRFSQTDSKGTAQIVLDPTVTGLTLMIGGPYSADDPKGKKNSRNLTDLELHQLFVNHKLTIRW